MSYHIVSEDKERMARALEAEGYTVIRAWTLASPDVIAFPAHLAQSIQAIRVKPYCTHVSAAEQAEKDRLESLGVDVSIRYVEPQVRATKQGIRVRIEAEGKVNFDAGYQAYNSGIIRTAFPRVGKPYRVQWQRTKKDWLFGWDEAQHDYELSQGIVSKRDKLPK